MFWWGINFLGFSGMSAPQIQCKRIYATIILGIVFHDKVNKHIHFKKMPFFNKIT